MTSFISHAKLRNDPKVLFPPLRSWASLPSGPGPEPCPSPASPSEDFASSPPALLALPSLPDIPSSEQMFSKWLWKNHFTSRFFAGIDPFLCSFSWQNSLQESSLCLLSPQSLLNSAQSHFKTETASVLLHPTVIALDLAEPDGTHRTLPNAAPALGSRAPGQLDTPPPPRPALPTPDGPSSSSQPFALASLGSPPWAPFLLCSCRARRPLWSSPGFLSPIPSSSLSSGIVHTNVHPTSPLVVYEFLKFSTPKGKILVSPPLRSLLFFLTQWASKIHQTVEAKP